MKNTIKTICLALALAVGSLSGNALADGHDKMGPYAGLGFGYTTLSGDNAADDKTWAPSIFGGYMLHPNFGIEGGYNWFSAEVGNNEGPNPELAIDTLYIAGIAKYPFSDEFSVYGKAGFHKWEVETKNLRLEYPCPSDVGAGVSFCARRSHGSEDGIDGLFGAGIQYELSEHASARLEYVRFLTDEGVIDGEADIVGFHLLYRL